MSNVSLCTEKRKPFDVLAEGPKSEAGTPNWRKLEPALVRFARAFEDPETYLLAADRLARRCA